MDAYGDASDVGESQASQLIHDLLEPGNQSSKKSPEARGNVSKPDFSAYNDNYSDSFPSSRNSNSQPHYHFHGLASTQTQSQHFTEDDGEINEGSQKENIGANGKAKETRQADPSAVSEPVSPHAPSTMVVPAKQPRAEQTSHSLSKTAVSKGIASKPTPTVTFLSPNRPASNLKPGKTNERPGRATSRVTRTTSRKSRGSSQDSFGRLSPNPEDRFLASSKKFDIPLSELGRITIDSEETLDATSSRGSPNSTMFAYSVPRRTGQRRSPSPQGLVLVASTPSNSESPQSQSQEIQQASLEENYSFARRQPDDTHDAMALDGHSDGDSQGYESSAPSSSYGRLLAGVPDLDAVAPELEATQPSTQPEDVDMVDPATEQLANHIWATAQSRNTTNPSATATTETTVATNSILSMVNPNNLWRYQKYQVAAQQGLQSAGGQAASTSHNQQATTSAGTWQETQPSEDADSTTELRGLLKPQNVTRNWEETQPSEEVEYSRPSRGFPAAPRPPNPAWESTQPSMEDENAMPPRRALPQRRLSNPPPPAQRSAPRNNTPDRRPRPSQDAMDVVPDSEPLRGDSSSTPYKPSPVKPRRTTDGLAGSSRDGVSNQGPNTTVGDVVPDSINMDDNYELTEEEEVTTEVQEKVAQRKEEEEDDDEDDVPLAAKSSSRVQGTPGRSRGRGRGRGGTSRGKEKARAPLSRSTVTLKASKATAAPPKAAAASSKGKGKQADQAMNAAVKGKKAAPSMPLNVVKSWEAGEVPSSMPEEDVLKAADVDRKRQPSGDAPKAGASKGRKMSAETSTPKTRGRRASPNLHKEEEELLKPNADDEGDDTTEPADPEDEDYMEVDLASDPSSRKRKRGAALTKTVNTRATTKAPSKVGKQHAITPLTRQPKRFRSGFSSMPSRTGSWEPTRVFAIWKQDGHFYSGIVHSLLDDGRYKIRFDDKTEGEVTLEQMRSCEIRVGDDILVANRSRSSKVVEVDKLNEGYVGVSIDDESVDLQLVEIRVAHKTITNAWKDRMIAPDSIVTLSGPTKPKIAPSPSKASLASAQSSKVSRRNILVKTGLMVTLSVGNENHGKDRGNVMSAIRASGGTVVEDISSVIRMDGKHYNSNNRWVISKNDVQWIGKSDVERLFLLADDANQKPKFLTALALGIPCLSINWLHDSLQAGEEKEWLGYTLPQGYSDALCARPSQQVDVDWGNSVHQLTDIVSNAVPSKLFSGKSILCVGSDMVPLPKGKTLPGLDEKAQDAINAVARIILSMGAGRVEAVTEQRYATADLTTYDYIVIKEASHYTPEMAEGTTVLWSWVKDCLIASRTLLLPEWDVMENSQET